MEPFCPHRHRLIEPFEKQAVNCFCFGLLLLLSCTFAVGQVSVENRHPDITLAERAFGRQLVTVNSLRAPAKAEEAVENAMKAMAHDRPKEAENQLAYALDLYPEYAKALTLRAIWEKANQPDRAITDLQRAIRLDPAYGLPHAVLASI